MNQPTESDCADQELIARYLHHGDADAFNQLYGRYRRQVYAYLNRLLASRPAAADDVFQQAWLRVIQQLPRYRHHEKFLPWLMRIAHNLAMDHYRRHRHEVLRDDLDAAATLSLGNDEPWRQLDRTELGQALEQCLVKLRPEQREVFLLRQDELPFREIAKIQTCSINTVLGRMQYALRNLRKCLGGWQGDR